MKTVVLPWPALLAYRDRKSEGEVETVAVVRENNLGACRVTRNVRHATMTIQNIFGRSKCALDTVR